MADYQPVSEAELEGSPPPLAAQAPAVPPSGPTQGYEPVNDNDLAPVAPMFQPGFRGPRGGIPNIPAAAAQRFKDSDAFNNIFQTAATRFANGFVNTFSALTIKDQQAMRDAGYGPGDFNSAGGALRWGAHVFGSTFNVLQDGFLALGPGIIEGVGGAAEQASRETGIGDPEMVGHEASGMAEAAMADVGDMHAMSMVDAARAQAKVPGVYSQAFRVDQTPGGGIVHTPMGRLPTEAEALPQAQVAADALHLPPATADLIHRTYLDTGRPPAETLMDAKANNGGVLSDLVAGKVPEAYGGPAAVLKEVTPEEAGYNAPEANEKYYAINNTGGERMGTAVINVEGDTARIVDIFSNTDKGPLTFGTTAMRGLMRQFLQENPEVKTFSGERTSGARFGGQRSAIGQEVAVPAPQSVEAEGKSRGTSAEGQTSPAEAPVSGQPEGAAQPTPAPGAPTGPIPYTPGTSKIGLSIERKAIEQGLTEGFDRTAGYDVKNVEDQKARTLDLAMNHNDDARAMIRGEQPVPSGVSPTMLIRAMENYAKETKDGQLQFELANSPLTSGTSYAAQEMRMMQERTPDSATAKFQEIRDAQEKQAGSPEQVKARKAAVKQARPAAEGVFLPKEQLSIDKFLDEIAC